ncbi:MAG: amino acid ABC transporter permease [Nocardioidaceae bacterium]
MTAATSTNSPPEALEIERRRHPWQLVAAALVILVLALLVRSLLLNDNLQWPTVGKYLFNRHVLDGVGVTLLLTVICQSLAIIGGVIVAVMRLSANRLLRVVASGYLWFFRGTPLLVQLVFWYNFAALFPVIFLGVPYTGLGHAYSTNALISGFTAAILGFSLHEGAYMAEIVRAGILSVGTGQREAALSTGMTEMRAMRRIILPQAMRVIIPPTGNQAINLLKATALVAFISGGDLLSNVKDIYAVNFAVIPLLVVASLWYLAMVSVASVGQHFLEKKVGKGVTRFGNGQQRRVADVDRLASSET